MLAAGLLGCWMLLLVANPVEGFFVAKSSEDYLIQEEEEVVDTLLQLQGQGPDTLYDAFFTNESLEVTGVCAACLVRTRSRLSLF